MTQRRVGTNAIALQLRDAFLEGRDPVILLPNFWCFHHRHAPGLGPEPLKCPYRREIPNGRFNPAGSMVRVSGRVDPESVSAVPALVVIVPLRVIRGVRMFVLGDIAR